MSAVDHPQDNRQKNRPTPKRKDAQAMRQRPLIPADRKAAKKADKERRNLEFQREQEALRTGEERYMPVAHRGRMRRFVRDYVDSRWSFSEFIVPVMLLFLVALTAIAFLQPSPEIAQPLMMTLSGVFYGLFLLSIIEAVFVWRRIKRELQEHFANEFRPRGLAFYAYSRMVMARRWRTPSPQIARGEKPSTR